MLALGGRKKSGTVVPVLRFLRAMKPMSSPAGCARFCHGDTEKRGHELLLGAIVWSMLRLPRSMLQN